MNNSLTPRRLGIPVCLWSESRHQAPPPSPHPFPRLPQLASPRLVESLPLCERCHSYRSHHSTQTDERRPQSIGPTSPSPNSREISSRLSAPARVSVGVR